MSQWVGFTEFVSCSHWGMFQTDRWWTVAHYPMLKLSAVVNAQSGV